MNAALIFDECDRDQNKYYDEHHALFVLREFENPEQTFHSVWHSFGIRYVARLTTSMIVMLSEAKHPATSIDYPLWFGCEGQRRIVSLN